MRYLVVTCRIYSVFGWTCNSPQFAAGGALMIENVALIDWSLLFFKSHHVKHGAVQGDCVLPQPQDSSCYRMRRSCQFGLDRVARPGTGGVHLHPCVEVSADFGQACRPSRSGMQLAQPGIKIDMGEQKLYSRE